MCRYPGNDPGPADPARPLLRDIVSRGTLFQTVRIRPSPHANQATSRNRLVGTEIRPSVPDLAPRRGATDEGPTPFRRPQGYRHAAKRDYPGAYAPPSLGRVLIGSVFRVAPEKQEAGTPDPVPRGRRRPRTPAPIPRQAVSRRLVGRSPIRARQWRSRTGDPPSHRPGRPHRFRRSTASRRRWPPRPGTAPPPSRPRRAAGRPAAHGTGPARRRRTARTAGAVA